MEVLLYPPGAGPSVMPGRPDTAPASPKVDRLPAGLTLIELVLAIAAAVLILSAVAAVLFTTLNTLDHQQAWRTSRVPADNVLDFLQRDLAGAVIPDGISNAAFSLAVGQPGATSALALAFYTAVALDEKEAGRLYGIHHVQYVWRFPQTSNVSILTRESTPFRVPLPELITGGALTWTDIHDFQCLARHGQTWTNTWEAGASNRLPPAVRLSLRLGAMPKTQRLETEILIPCGQRISAPGQKP